MPVNGCKKPAVLVLFEFQSGGREGRGRGPAVTVRGGGVPGEARRVGFLSLPHAPLSPAHVTVPVTGSHPSHVQSGKKGNPLRMETAEYMEWEVGRDTHTYTEREWHNRTEEKGVPAR